MFRVVVFVLSGAFVFVLAGCGEEAGRGTKGAGGGRWRCVSCRVCGGAGRGIR